MCVLSKSYSHIHSLYMREGESVSTIRVKTLKNAETLIKKKKSKMYSCSCSVYIVIGYANERLPPDRN